MKYNSRLNVLGESLLFQVIRAEHQKLNRTTAELSFGWVFGVQLGSLEKSDSPKTFNREEY